MEKWIKAKIKNVEGYEVSNLGSLRNIKTKRVLKDCVKKDGYRFYRITHKGVKINIYKHRLVAVSFLGTELGEVNHINGNPEDCRLENLEWVDKQTNLKLRRTVKNIRDQVRTLYEMKAWASAEEFKNFIIENIVVG